MPAPVAALLAANPLSIPSAPHTRAAPFIALAIFGFVLAVIGHLFRSRLAVITGIVLLMAATVILPFVLYVGQR